MSQVRTFIAIEIPDVIRQKIAAVQEKLKKAGERISWTKPGNIHLTLKFLGDVKENQIEPIADAVKISANGIRPFSFQVGNLGAFPDIRRARVLWVDVVNPTNELAELAKRIEDQLSKIGFKKETRKFNPHLTMGRVKSRLGEKFIVKFENLTFEEDEVRVEGIIVMKSELNPAGSIYTPLQKIKLRLT